MNALKINSRLLSLLFLLVALTMTTSCEHKIVDELPVPEVEEVLVSNKYPEGRLAKRMVLTDKNDDSKGAVISVSTNTSEILHLLTDANMEAKLITPNDLAQLENDHLPEEVDLTNEASDESLLNSEIHFFTLTILEERTSDGEAIQYTFSDELLAVLKKHKASTHVQFPTKASNPQDSRAEQVWKNGFWAYGDGGSIRTKLKVHYSYGCTGPYYSRDTNSGFLYSYKFRSCKWPWNSSQRKWYSGFSVIQDVLRNFTIFNTNECGKCANPF